MKEREVLDTSQDEPELDASEDNQIEETESFVETDVGPEITSDSQVDAEEETQESSESAAEPERPSLDFEREYKALQPEFTRRSQELKELARAKEELELKLKRYDDVDPDAIRQYKETQALPPWNPNSQAHADFMSAQQRLQVIQAAPGITDEQRRDWAAQQLNEKELGWIHDWNSYRREEHHRMLSDPEKYIAARVEKKVEEIVNSRITGHQQSKETETQVQSIFASTEFRKSYLTEDGNGLSEHGEKLNAMLAGGVPYQIAHQAMQSQVRADALTKENEYLRRKSMSVQERERLLKDGATERRQVRVGGGDVAEEAKRIAKEKGYAIGSDAHLELLINLESKE